MGHATRWEWCTTSGCRSCGCTRTTGGACRPLFIVKDQQLAVKKSHIERLQQHEITHYGWQDLIQDGLLECVACEPKLMLHQQYGCR